MTSIVNYYSTAVYRRGGGGGGKKIDGVHVFSFRSFPRLFCFFSLFSGTHTPCPSCRYHYIHCNCPYEPPPSSLLCAEITIASQAESCGLLQAA